MTNTRVNMWLAIGLPLHDEFNTRLAYEKANQEPDDPKYQGPLDDITWDILNTMGDLETTRPMWETKSVNGVPDFHLYSCNFFTPQEATDAYVHIVNSFLGTQEEINGLWYLETGLQVGQYFDAQGDAAGIPAFPFPKFAYELMPDITIYDDNGDVVEKIPPTSNDDLRDLNLLSGQAPRNFDWSE